MRWLSSVGAPSHGGRRHSSRKRSPGRWFTPFSAGLGAVGSAVCADSCPISVRARLLRGTRDTACKPPFKGSAECSTTAVFQTTRHVTYINHVLVFFRAIAGRGRLVGGCTPYRLASHYGNEDVVRQSRLASGLSLHVLGLNRLKRKPPKPQEASRSAKRSGRTNRKPASGRL